ncbi:conserved hypothetical protein [Roseibium sp. TrichSKD4]|uniref:hypothetical protein n=1 Tax=Roseibium sp. TrichSKD4 TaxID=744980 RepID=UPI0001E5637D|nr:hypothetical protein [Roseibium sp. TrichSKD4]EFO33895.1 conserved hypothetical protein [Roseibium sp. TrichSKD4]
MRRVSLNQRLSLEDASSDEVEVALFVFEHSELEEPVRLSSDPTERLWSDPLAYGTRSTFNDSNPSSEPFHFVLVSTDLPSDLEEAPAEATLVLENVTRGIADVLQSITTRATAHMAIVLASSPDVIEAEYRDLRLVRAEGDASEITLSISRESIEEEAFPSARMTKQRFPGLHR